MEKILSFKNPLVYPNDVMEPLLAAVAITTLKPCRASANELKLFKAYLSKDKSFMGTCWCYKFNELYFLYFVGSESIIKADANEFIFEESNEIFAPVQISNDFSTILVCEYTKHCDNFEIKAKEIRKVKLPNFTDPMTVHTFDKDYSFDEGVDFFYSTLN